MQGSGGPSRKAASSLSHSSIGSGARPTTAAFGGGGGRVSIGAEKGWTPAAAVLAAIAESRWWPW